MKNEDKLAFLKKPRKLILNKFDQYEYSIYLREKKKYSSYKENYSDFNDRLEKNGLRMATMYETLLILEDLFFSSEISQEQKKEVIYLLEKGICTGTKILFTPHKMDILSNKEIAVFSNKDLNSLPKNLKYKIGELNEFELKEMGKLIKKKCSVNYLNFGYKTGTLNLQELVKNEFIDALIGQEKTIYKQEIAQKLIVIKRGLEKLVNTKHFLNHIRLDINTEVEFPKILYPKIYIDKNEGPLLFGQLIGGYFINIFLEDKPMNTSTYAFGVVKGEYKLE